MYWYYDDTKRTPTEKIQLALDAYRARFTEPAAMVLCHPDDLVQRADVLVVTGDSQGMPTNKNNFRVCGTV